MYMRKTDSDGLRVYNERIMNEAIFKAYDIRGVYPTDIDEEAAYKIAQAYAKFLHPKTVVVGRDVRLSGPALFEAVVKGLTDHGVDVIDIIMQQPATADFIAGKIYRYFVREDLSPALQKQ